MEEIFKDIEGFEGLYQVSNFGNVKSLGNDKNRKEKILKPQMDGGGYLIVGLCKDGKQNTHLIHRLVATAFIPNEDLFKTDINHIDEDKTNNRVDNLEWCTRKENINYGKHNERMAKSKSKPVNQYSLDGELIKTWQSTNEIQRTLGYSCGNISQCCNGKFKQRYGYIWKYGNSNC